MGSGHNPTVTIIGSSSSHSLSLSVSDRYTYSISWYLPRKSCCNTLIQKSEIHTHTLSRTVSLNLSSLTNKVLLTWEPKPSLTTITTAAMAVAAARPAAVHLPARHRRRAVTLVQSPTTAGNCGRSPCRSSPASCSSAVSCGCWWFFPCCTSLGLSCVSAWARSALWLAIPLTPGRFTGATRCSGSSGLIFRQTIPLRSRFFPSSFTCVLFILCVWILGKGMKRKTSKIFLKFRYLIWRDGRWNRKRTRDIRQSFKYLEFRYLKLDLCVSHSDFRSNKH